MVHLLRKTYEYVDRFYVKNNHMKNLYQIGIDIFYETVFDKSKHLLTSTMVKFIEMEREGKEIDRDSFKKVLAC